MKVFVEYNEPIGPISGFGLGDGTPGGLIIEKRVFLIFFSCGASMRVPSTPKFAHAPPTHHTHRTSTHIPALLNFLTRVQRTRANLGLEHWLLCHLGLY